MNKTIEEYKENRTSWKFLKRKLDSHPPADISGYVLDTFILLEILKELQFMNDFKLKEGNR